MNEMFLVQQALSGIFGVNGLLLAVHVAGLYAMLHWPDRVRRPGLFKLACLLLLLALILPGALNLCGLIPSILSGGMGMGGPFSRGGPDSMVFTFLGASLSPILMGLSIYCALLSMLGPLHSPRVQQPSPLKPHPLD